MAAGVLYTWQLSASGTANSFYAAAVQAGSESWKAWFFGSLDSANSITVDKPPAALWVMGLSARVFGFSSWSLLLPQALEGVAAVGLLVAAVRRVAGPVAGLAAGAALALTPAAVLIFRFDNPDALLVLTMVAAAYAVTRAVQGARTRWLVAAGLAIGLGFLTKSGQALLPVPALGLAYLVAAPTGLWRRVRQLLVAGAAVVAGAGWWLALVAFWPASDRPYIGGSTNDSAWELAFGYNGLGRLFGGSGNSSGGGGSSSNTSFGGATGLGRLFRGEFALEISWLLPAALLALAAGLWLTARRPRTDPARAGLVLWGGWLLTTAGVFSFMQGTIHPYYTVALAPALAAVVAIGVQLLWARRDAVGGMGLALTVAATGAWGAVLLHDNASSVTWATPVAVVVAFAGAAASGALVLRAAGVGGGRRTLVAIAVAGVLALAAPTAAWGTATATTAHSGSIPTAVASSTASGGPGANAGMGGGGSAGTSTALTTALSSSTTRWSAATVGSQSAATLELASDTAVMAIGGWSGSDASPTLAQFTGYVAAGQIHYFIASTGGGGGGGSSTSEAATITAWVEAHYTATTIGGQTIYDLTAPAS